MIHRKKIFALLITFVFALSSYADRIYVMNASGYNSAKPELIDAMISLGHTVVENNFDLDNLPVGFTSSCADPINGYDWLCFFGDEDNTDLINEIQAFIDSGGKVFYQYEVSCCISSSTSVASILSSLTGLTITPNVNDYIAVNLSPNNPGFEASISCCATFKGNAYKGLDGLPLANQLLTTSNLNGSMPLIENCLNFGFSFSTTDFVGTADRGVIIGLGDYNLWYDGGEPFVYGGTIPINTQLVEFIFPNNSSSCFAYPPGCMIQQISIPFSVLILI